MSARPGVFFDRDGVLNPDVGYPHRAADATLFPDVADGLRRIQQAGYILVVTSNQSGIGRGLFSEEESRLFNALLAEQLRQRGVDLPQGRFYVCPHPPDAGCECRKPRPGLFLRAAGDLDIDLARSLAVGDREIDVQAARAAGVRACLLDRGGHRPSIDADHVVRDLTQLAELSEQLAQGERKPGFSSQVGVHDLARLA
ncbi:MAG: HAD family hydrolase [Deltaproteobacteria bacterium]|nr:HAD family hydrolase [Deltaproteobacteria bacterium]